MKKVAQGVEFPLFSLPSNPDEAPRKAVLDLPAMDSVKEPKAPGKCIAGIYK
jgi:hypothetical protein